MMFQGEHSHTPKRTTGEHVEHADDAALILVQELTHHGRIDARNRDVGSQTIDDERTQGEPDAVFFVVRSPWRTNSD